VGQRGKERRKRGGKRVEESVCERKKKLLLEGQVWSVASVKEQQPA
jgi:hypothetical protein